MKSRGFTLIELLFVIAILFMLTSILFPVFISAREKGRATVCLSNLRSLGVAIAMYKSDWDGSYPNAVDGAFKYRNPDESNPPLSPEIQSLPLIQDVLFPYTKDNTVFRCPSDLGIRNKTLPRSAFDAFGSSYSVSHLLCGETDAFFSDGSQLIYMSDLDGEWHTKPYASYYEMKINVLYLDNHVKFIGSGQGRSAIGLSYPGCVPRTE